MSPIDIVYALLRLLFWSLGKLAGLASFFLVKGTTLVVTVLIEALRLPFAAASVALSYGSEHVKACLWQLLGFLSDSAASVSTRLAELGKIAAGR